jgi:predicted nucleotidyltransferase
MFENAVETGLLFGRSKIRHRVLALLFDRPERRLHLRAIARLVGASAGTTARELDRVVGANLVGRTTEGRQVYFQANADSAVFEAVQTLVRRTLGAPSVLRRHLAGLEHIDRAFLYGSYARNSGLGPASDIDLMIVGEPDPDRLTDAIAQGETELGRPVNYTILTETELDRRRKRGDRYIESIDSGPTIPVIGNVHD